LQRRWGRACALAPAAGRFRAGVGSCTRRRRLHPRSPRVALRRTRTIRCMRRWDLIG